MGFTTDGQYSPRGQLDVLEPATIHMLKTVYGAGLTAGTTRPVFEAAGYVPPESAVAATAVAPDRKGRGYFIEEDGVEMVIHKPFCQGLR
jgi:hypothetical protein